jgi:hypothetical protein
VAILAAALLPSTADAAPMMNIRPNVGLFGAPGDTVGWGYDVINDSDGTLFLSGISADVPSANGSISVGVFDFFNFQFFLAPHEEMHIDYDALAGVGLVELTLGALMTPGEVITGRVFVDYLLNNPGGGIGPESLDPGTFELQVSATATGGGPAPIPEPSTLLLMGTGAMALLGRRRLRPAR